MGRIVRFVRINYGSGFDFGARKSEKVRRKLNKSLLADWSPADLQQETVRS